MDNGLDRLPTVGIHTAIGKGGISGSAEEGAMHNALGVIVKDLEGHDVANMFRDADKVTTPFA